MNNEQLYKYIARCQEEFDTIDEEAPYEWKALGVLTFQIGRASCRERV